MNKTELDDLKFRAKLLERESNQAAKYLSRNPRDPEARKNADEAYDAWQRTQTEIAQLEG